MICEEVEQTMDAEHAFLSAFREFASTTLSLDSMRSLTSRVIELYFSAKFDQCLASFINHSWTSLSVPLSFLRDKTVAKISRFSVDEASKLFIQDLIAYFLKVSRLGRNDFQFLFIYVVGVVSL